MRPWRFDHRGGNVSLLEECALECPYCGESISVLVDTSESQQCYVEDCEVCCRPMVLSLEVSEEGEVWVNARREDD